MTSVQPFLQTAIDFLISPPPLKHRFASRVYLGLLFLGGLLLWGAFFNWGQSPITYHDWVDITLPRLTILKEAVVTGQVPLHTENPSLAGGLKTTRFLAIPDLILSPQVFLLRYLTLSQFALFQVCLVYALGFLGLLRFQQVQQLSLLAFTVIFFLFNFNGHILAHLSVGHLTWGGYFLLTWFALLVFELLDGKGGWRWMAQVSLLLLVILLQGSYSSTNCSPSHLSAGSGFRRA